MSFINKRGFLNALSTCVQAKRYRGKINIQRPQKPNFQRATFLAVAKPYFPKYIAPIGVCDKDVKYFDTDKIENPLQNIIARECLEEFKSSELVVLFHSNPMKMERYNYARLLFHRQQMTLQNYGRKTLEIALKGTQYEAFLEHYVFHNLLVFSSKANIKAVLKVNKKFPQLIILSGILHGRYINKDELIKYSQIPSLQTAQAELVQTINNVGSTLVTQLTTNQQVLASQLEERIKQLDIK